MYFVNAIFKILSKNDSGMGAGNQAGFLIPTELRSFFPPLPVATFENPAPSITIDAILISDQTRPVRVVTRWQAQTWDNQRSPETRLTGELEIIRKYSREGDLILIEKREEGIYFQPPVYRMTLLSRGTQIFDEVLGGIGNKKWGFLSRRVHAISEIQEESYFVKEKSAAPFRAFDDDSSYVRHGRRYKRARAFRNLVIEEYGGRCAICGCGLRLSSGATELEAAHVIPKFAKGVDDVRNGLALCRTHHWAFDNWLIGILPNGILRIAPIVSTLPQNVSLLNYDGKHLFSPKNEQNAVHLDAILWSERKFNEIWQRG